VHEDKLSILIISQVFPPEIGAYRMIYSCGEALSRMGHKITVISGLPNYPAGIIPEPYKGRLVVREEMEGMDIHRVFLIPSSNEKPKKRLWTFFTFMISSFIRAFTMRNKFDIVLSVSPPLTVGISGYFLARVKRLPSALYMLDLEPESAIALGHLEGSMFVKIAGILSRFLYKKSELILAFSKGARDILTEQKKIEPKKVGILTGGVDTSLFRPLSKDRDLLKSLDLTEKFIVLYTGTFGRIQHLSTLIEAAEILKTRNDIAFVLVGDGEERAKLEAMVREKNLAKSVQILPAQPTELIPKYLSIADLCITTTKKAELHEGIIPAKILEYCSSGKPILAAIEGETKELLEKNQCGIGVPPEMPALLAEGIVSLGRDAALLEKMGRNGRDLVLKQYSSEVLGQSLCNMLMSAISSD